METDLFASIRKQDTGVSTSFSSAPATPQHVPAMGATRQDPQKSAAEHLQPLKHRESVEGRISPSTDRRVTVPEIRAHDNDHLPLTWREGLNRLNAMPAPRAARPGRWRELVIDAHRLAWAWHDVAAERGWSVEALFAFNAKDPFQDEAGLVFSIRSGRVLSLFGDDRGRAVAALTGGAPDMNGGCRWFYRRPIANPHLIWGPSAPELLR